MNQIRTDAFLRIDFWSKLSPHFSVGGLLQSSALRQSAEENEKGKKQLIREGYVHLVNPGLHCSFKDVATILSKIVTLGLPPVFIFIYDEIWDLNRQLRCLISNLLQEECALLPDFWAWHVVSGQSGWKPHRDKSVSCLFPDKRPKSVTVWVPITQAHPLNGCMYVVPADRDLEYGVGNSEKEVYSLSDVRALPAEAGDVLVWTQHLFHWGGHSAEHHNLPPRMSVAFEYQRRDVTPFNLPLLDPAVSLDFGERLALIGKQVMQYRHMYGFHPDLVHLAERIAAKYPLPKGLSM